MLPVFVTNRLALYILWGSSLIWFIPELISSFTQNRARNAQTHDRASGFVLILCMYVGIYLGLQSAFSSTQFAIPWARIPLFGVGIFLMFSGMAFRWYSILVLGRYFTRVISIQSGHAVVEQGPYRYIRHPSYTGAMLTFAGFGLALTNWLSLVVVVLAMCIGYGYRVRVEEQVLIEGLGQPYQDYMKRTKRFIPFIL